MIIFVSIIFGLIVGSFLNVVIFRLQSKQPFTGRSHCPNCQARLEAVDLVPILSFVWLKGRCRHCQAAISWQYPVVEALTALLFAAAAGLAGGITLAVVFQWALLALFVVVAVYDFKHYLILDKVVFPGLVLALAANIASDAANSCAVGWGCATMPGLIGAAIISGFFYLQYLLSRGKWIGFGDVKFGLLLGMVSGLVGSFLTLFAAYMIGAFAGLILIALGKKQMSSRLPFGTVLAAGAVVTMLFGPDIISWYVSLI